MRVSLRRFLPLLGAALLLSAAGCRSCAPPRPPTVNAAERMGDPYEKIPADVKGEARTRAVLEQASQAMGYGDAPLKAFDKHRSEPWTDRLVLFLSHGGTAQIRVAWDDVRSTLIESFWLPAPIKREVREAEARVLDMKTVGVSEKAERQVLLAEIVWALYLLDAHGTGGAPDSGSMP